jgi:hypothetical protein
MNDTESRPRRSLVVVLLDGVLRLVAAVHAGPAPVPKVREAGGRRGVGRYLLVAGALVALAGTALLVVVLVRATGGPTPPPDRAAPLPGLQSRPAAPSVTGSAVPRRPDPTATSAAGKAAAVSPAKPAPSPSAKAPTGESSPVPLTASYRTSSATAGLLGYQVTVTVANPGETTKDGWLLTVTLPRSTLRVSGVDGATTAQDGSVWTFTPDASTARVPAGDSVELSFDVRGATLIDAAPQDCRIDGKRCGA